jgi:hypothetical protein
MVTPEYIKTLIEFKLGGIDISVKSRKRELVYCRYVGYALCKTYGGKKIALRQIGEPFGKRDHATVLHGLKEFDYLKDQKFFSEYMKLHDNCVNSINSELNLNPDFKTLQSIQQVENHFRIKHITLVEKSHAVIGSLTAKLHKLRHKPIFEDLAALSDSDFKEFEVRANAFLQMTKNK